MPNLIHHRLGLVLATPIEPNTDDWMNVALPDPAPGKIGITFRPHQAQDFGLDSHETLRQLLTFPLQIVRLGCYWNESLIEENRINLDDVQWQIDLCQKAGAKAIVCVGAFKTFGYPEYFLPERFHPSTYRRGTLFSPEHQGDLVKAAAEFVAEVVERLKGQETILAWQLENEPGDPMIVANNWRLSRTLVEQELAALRQVDATTPVVINGYFAISPLIHFGKSVLTRDQGDAIQMGLDLADIVGIDDYPCVALAAFGKQCLYLDTTLLPAAQTRRQRLLAKIAERHKRAMIIEGQAEPWELSIVPPTPEQGSSHSCTPADMLRTYTYWADDLRSGLLDAYLFWGAEYWIARDKQGDSRYLRAFARLFGA